MSSLLQNGARPHTGNTTLARQLNRSLILDYIKLSGPTGVTALALALGLHRTTVYSQVRELIADGLLTLGPTTQAGTGRPGRLVALNLHGRSIIGAQLGIKGIQAVVADLEGTIIERRAHEIDPHRGFDSIFAEIVATIGEAIAVARQLERPPMGIGIAVPGLVDPAGGRIRWTVNLGWHDVDLGPMLQARFGLPVWVKNGAQAALLGERYFGAGRSLRDWIYLNVGVEIAAGFFLGGQPYFGRDGYAGEVGHTVLEPDGPACSCGNRGCWEALASERALLRRYHEAGGSGSPSVAEVAGRADRDEQPAQTALDAITRYLALGIVNLLHTFDPEGVVIGGEFAGLGDRLLDRIIGHVEHLRILSQKPLRSKLTTSVLGSDVALLGAVSIVLHATLDGPRVI